eukprot:TRINITY_DN5986_c0_g1_i2.p1 TRINITY_DN5986_c0_g1~~TRINITY_DN5986_c0_g1_i2.p1  ORF type:complete len:101 (-),score=3.07 TRINITY_DN5986_c0_g1_i2:265-567(-)
MQLVYFTNVHRERISDADKVLRGRHDMFCALAMVGIGASTVLCRRRNTNFHALQSRGTFEPVCATKMVDVACSFSRNDIQTGLESRKKLFACVCIVAFRY